MTTPAHLRSFIIEVNQHIDKKFPLEATRLSKIQADGLYQQLQRTLEVEKQPLQRTSLLRAWQDLRELGFDTDLEPPK